MQHRQPAQYLLVQLERSVANRPVAPLRRARSAARARFPTGTINIALDAIVSKAATTMAPARALA